MANIGGGFVGRILGAVITLAVVLGGAWVWQQFQEKDAKDDAPKVGTCVNMKGTITNANHDELDCGDASATYEIVADDGKCDDAEINYTISLGTDRNSGNVADLCLALNAAEGDCFNLGGIASPAKKVACTEAKKDPAIQKVVSVGKSGDKCAEGSEPLENVTRKTVICFGAAA